MTATADPKTLSSETPLLLGNERKWTDYFGFSTDHKVIGIQYLVTAFFFYLVGGSLATVMRTELATPAPDVVTPDVYNGLLTLHGTVMLFLWIVPAGAGLANYLIPLMIGARDMAFPRLNAIAFWLIPPSGLLLISSFLLRATAGRLDILPTAESNDRDGR